MCNELFFFFFFFQPFKDVNIFLTHKLPSCALYWYGTTLGSMDIIFGCVLLDIFVYFLSNVPGVFAMFQIL